MSAVVPWIIFLLCAAVVYAASQWLARSGDALAERTGMSRAFVGILLLATATSLPELATGASAVAVADSVDLAAGGIFGSNVFNLAVIALMELFVPRAALLSTVQRTLLTPTLLSGALIGLAGVFVLLPHANLSPTLWLYRGTAPILFGAYVLALLWMVRSERHNGPDAEPADRQRTVDDWTLRRASVIYLLATTVIVFAGIGLAVAGDRIGKEMGWSSSFVGTLLLAASTSLPEIATSLAALRIGARDLAVANMVGSNLFNTGVVVFVLDMVYGKGSFLASLSSTHLSTIAISLGMTAVVAVAVLARPRGKLVGRLTPELFLLAGLFLAAQLLTF